ncbi:MULTISPECIES: cupin domain-containing protein [Clostridia]|uniref:cupin domain-containing protein n=1 Tax=Clostridia TaxID=186801 RepID=UPI00047FF1E5|nr:MULTISPECIES: cupin domain-containing protein [Clostridia]SDH20825.1 ethanolamine utilization protein EutQ [Halanaerobium congolense]SHM69442.1 ethanolamine utilization protein EutQ [Halanaerobium congolense]
MKTLISVNEIKSLAGAGKKVLYLEPGTIITPAARDAANEWGITIKNGPAPQEPEVCCQPVKEETTLASEPVVSSVSPEMISRIVMEVMAKLPQFCMPEIVKEVDPKSGFCLVKGNTVACDTFDTGNPKDKVGIKEILTRRESPNMATGFMTMEKSSFDWHLGYEEIDYVVEGTLEFIVNGKKFTGHAGDVFYIPAGTDVTFTTPDKCKFFFVTYPANWADLSGK